MIDINCDIGEHYGVYKLGDDRAIMPFVTSVNIACGFHAGDPKVMYETVKNALEFKLNIGAHPGYEDKIGFGRRPMAYSLSDIYQMTLYQMGALDAMIKVQGSHMNHVKAHGALYNKAAEDFEVAKALVRAIYDYDRNLKIYGLANTKMEEAAKDLGLTFVAEVFADRNIDDQGLLVPRGHAQAMIETAEKSADHIKGMLETGRAISINGKSVDMKAETVCVHGDNDHAVAFAKTLYHLLKE